MKVLVTASCLFPASSCGANVDRKNASGQTAFQLAAEAGCNEMVSLLAAQTGLALLDKLAKRK